jgi:hypothetical protein
MKKIIFALIATFLLAGFVIAQSPFRVYNGELCNDGTFNYDFKIEKAFSSALMIRLNVYAVPLDTLSDTLTIVWATKYTAPNQTGMQSLSAIQDWTESEDTLFATAAADTSTALLMFPFDSLSTGYNGVYLGDWFRIKFVNTDTLLTGISNAWCDTLTTSLKWQLVVGYF